MQKFLKNITSSGVSGGSSSIAQTDRNRLLKIAIEKEFFSFEKFKELFMKVAVTHFGSGWVWLSKDINNKLVIESLPNQDCPLSKGSKPILCLDLWEHAYYLKYQNRRAEYVEAWWNVVDWEGAR